MLATWLFTYKCCSLRFVVGREYYSENIYLANNFLVRFSGMMSESLETMCFSVSGAHEPPKVGRSIKPMELTVVEWHFRKLHVWILNCKCLWL